MSDRQQTQLDSLVASIAESSKYRAVSEDLIRNIGSRELSVRRSLKEAVKATKNKLHQVAGAYLDSKPQYAAWIDDLAAVLAENDDESLRKICRTIMEHHASTRERIRIVETFYLTILADLPPIRSILDLGCGLNPLALPWMQLAPDVTYYACDIYADMMAFLNSYFQLIGVRGHAEVCDLAHAPPSQPVDVALVFKLLPTLEQQDKQAGLRLLHALNAAHILVSFPVRSLGGRDKGMAEQYAHRFEQLVLAEGWSAERMEFHTELVFRVSK